MNKTKALLNLMMGSWCVNESDEETDNCHQKKPSAPVQDRLMI